MQSRMLLCWISCVSKIKDMTHSKTIRFVSYGRFYFFKLSSDAVAVKFSRPGRYDGASFTTDFTLISQLYVLKIIINKRKY